MSDNRYWFYKPEDAYVFCAECGNSVFDYCAIHGPPLIVADTKVGASRLPRELPAAAHTLPNTLLHFARSTIPEAGLGVFSSTAIPPNVRFGPCRGVRTQQITSMYCWKVSYKTSPEYVIDAQDANKSNWLRYVNCSRHFREQNLLAYQHRGQIYYRTIKLIERNTELLVFYGCEFATLLGIDLTKYFRAQCYDEVTAPSRKSISRVNELPRDDDTSQLASQADSPATPANREPHSTHTTRDNVIKHIDNITTCTALANITNHTGNIVTSTTLANIINETVNIATHNTIANVTNHTSNIATYTTLASATNHTGNTATYTTLANVINQTGNIATYNSLANVTNHTGNIGTYNKLDNATNNTGKIATYNRLDNIINHTDNIATYNSLDNNTNHTGNNATYNTVDNDTTHNGNIATYNPLADATNNSGNRATCTTLANVTNHIGNIATNTTLANVTHHTGSIKTSGIVAASASNGQASNTATCNECSFKRFTCTYCNYKTNSNQILKTHTNAMHTKVTSYDCSFCSYKTYYRGYVKTHINATHTKTTSYNCSLCDYKTYYSGVLSAHMKAKHSNATSNNCN